VWTSSLGLSWIEMDGFDLPFDRKRAMYSAGTLRGSHFRTARIALSACARQSPVARRVQENRATESDPSGLKTTLICATYVSPSGTPGGGVQQVR